jgi:4'-phosphopantetheinyl transferase
MIEIYATSNEENAFRAMKIEWLIKTIIHEKLKIQPEEIIISRNVYGKPYLTNKSNFHFNVSHSGKWSVCAVGDRPLGIDIELIDRINMKTAEKIAERFFSKEECEELFLRDYKDRLAYFCEIWTLKESFLKALGKGLTNPLNSFTIKKRDTGIELKSCLYTKYCFEQYNIDRDYRMAVCSKDSNFASEIIFK